MGGGEVEKRGEEISCRRKQSSSATLSSRLRTVWGHRPSSICFPFCCFTGLNNTLQKLFSVLISFPLLYWCGTGGSEMPNVVQSSCGAWDEKGRLVPEKDFSMWQYVCILVLQAVDDWSTSQLLTPPLLLPLARMKTLDIMPLYLSRTL